MDLDELLKKALAEEAEGKTKGGPSPDEMLKMAEALEKIRRGDLGEKPERAVNLSPIDKAVADLKAGKPFKRALATRAKVSRPKAHWSKKRAAKRKYDRTRYTEVLRPMRKQALAERIQTAEGWWEVARKGWERHGIPVEMTEQEFCEVVYPAFYPHVPVFFRLDKGKGWSLDNLLVRDTETRKVLFDGNEHTLKLLGFVL